MVPIREADGYARLNVFRPTSEIMAWATAPAAASRPSREQAKSLYAAVRPAMARSAATARATRCASSRMELSKPISGLRRPT